MALHHLGRALKDDAPRSGSIRRRAARCFRGLRAKVRAGGAASMLRWAPTHRVADLTEPALHPAQVNVTPSGEGGATGIHSFRARPGLGKSIFPTNLIGFSGSERNRPYPWSSGGG